MKNLFPVVVLLLASVFCLVYSEAVSRDETNRLPTNTYHVYPIGDAENQTVCPVFGNERTAILQSPSIGGNFSTVGLNSTLFSLRHIVHTCRPTGNLVVGDTCDLLAIECVLDPDRRDSFLVSYVSSSGGTIDVAVSYGPEGITLVRDALPASGDHILLTNNGLTFELRTSHTIDPVATVCESTDGGKYSPSTLLLARSNQRNPNCIQALDGGLSIPFIIRVRPINGATENGYRLVKITFGMCNTSNLLVSELLHITGPIEATSLPVAETTSQEIFIVATSTITTTTTDLNSVTAVQSPVSTIGTISLPLTTPTPSPSPTAMTTPSAGHTAIIVVSVVIVSGLLVLIMVSIATYFCWSKRRPTDLEKRRENVDAGKDLDLDLAIVSCEVKNNFQGKGEHFDVVVSEVITQQPNSSSDPPNTPLSPLPNMRPNNIHSESFSECESEGSEVALVRDIAMANGEKIAELVIRYSEATIACLDNIHNQTKQNNATEQIDEQNITAP